MCTKYVYHTLNTSEYCKPCFVSGLLISQLINQLLFRGFLYLQETRFFTLFMGKMHVTDIFVAFYFAKL